MPGCKQILIVENNAEAARLALQLLEEGPYDLHLAVSCMDARAILEKKRIDAILLGSPANDACLPSLDHLKESCSDPAVIALLDADEQERYLACHKEGALDCLMAPFSKDRLVKSLERCMAIKSLERERLDFISMLSHDLKNPITAAIGSVDLVRSKRLGVLNNEQEEYLQSAIESCNEVVAMIDNLLDIHRHEAGKITFSMVPTNLAELVRHVANGFRGVAKQSQLQLQLMIDEKLPLLPIDRAKFSRVIANLLTNAVKFTPNLGEIKLSCSSGISADSQPSVIIQINDTGNGIADVDLPLIFDRFVQARNQCNRGSGGSGLGLAFCKMAVEAHGGTITVESHEGVGSVFTIVLPFP